MTSPSMIVLDDEPDIAEFVRDVAEGLGFDSRTTNTPLEFLELVAREDFDVIALDLVMPGMDGIELISHLAKAGCKSGILFISGYNELYLNSARKIAIAKDLRVLGTISKPIRLDELENRLRTALEEGLGVMES